MTPVAEVSIVIVGLGKSRRQLLILGKRKAHRKAAHEQVKHTLYFSFAEVRLPERPPWGRRWGPWFRAKVHEHSLFSAA